MDHQPTLALLTRAINFAAIKHADQRRKVGDIPYINHPIDVMNILATAGVHDLNVLCAAVLHDTIEDTETSASELEKEFGAKIKQIVLECSDDKDLPAGERKKQQIHHASHASNEAKLIKIADKLSNNWDLLIHAPPKWSKERVSGYHLWSYAVCRNLYGVNEKLDEKMRDLFKQTGTLEIPEEEMEGRLEEYYKVL